MHFAQYALGEVAAKKVKGRIGDIHKKVGPELQQCLQPVDQLHC
jgi:hypothetical protein